MSGPSPSSFRRSRIAEVCSPYAESMTIAFGEQLRAIARNRAEPHEAVQRGDVVKAGVEGQDHTVACADAALIEVRSKCAGAHRGVSEGPSRFGVRGSIRQEYIGQLL